MSDSVQNTGRSTRSLLRRMLPRPLVRLGKRIVDAEYRRDYARCREIERLESLPRYTPCMTSLLGAPFEAADPAVFIGMYREIFLQRIYEFRAMRRDPLIVDGGANVGLAIAFWQRLFPECRVLAFEPDPTIYSVLKRNVERSEFANVTLEEKALWSSSTSLEFLSEGSNASRLAQSDDRATTRVQTVRLRDYLNQEIDFLKLDVEGAETEILKDCADRLERVRNLFVEYHSFESQPQVLHSLLTILANAGFRIHVHPIFTSSQPFIERPTSLGMDMQLNIFAFRTSS